MIINQIEKAKLFLKKLDSKSIILLKNLFWSILVKGGAAIVSLYTIPVFINYFNNETILGLWFTSISLVNWILTFDIGIGNGLRNFLVDPIVNKKDLLIKEYISSAYFSMFAIIAIISILVFLLMPLVNWNVFFGLSENTISWDSLNFMMQMLTLGTLMNFALKLITSVLYAMQKSALVNFLSLLSALLILFFALFAKTDDVQTNLKSLSVAYVFLYNIPLLIATIYIFTTKLKHSIPNISYFSKSSAFSIINLGLNFFLVQLLLVGIFGVNEILIYWLSSPADVVIFQIYNKLFALVSTLFNLALIPVWSAVTEAVVKNDIKWIKDLRKKMNLGLIFFSIGGILLVINLQFIVDFWLNNDTIKINYLYSIYFLAQSLISIKIGIDSSFIYGIGKLKTQIIALSICVVLKFVISIIVVNLLDNWIYVIIGTMIAMVPTIIIINFDTNKKINELENKAIN